MKQTTSPYSIRFTPKERASIAHMAKQQDMSDAAFIRFKVFEEYAQQHVSNKELAKILTLLGQARLANNLNQLAKAANLGTLILSPDVKAQIDELYDTVMWIRRALIEALGLKP